MDSHIQEVYNLGLEKFAGDTEAAKDFTVGFLKEAFSVVTEDGLDKSAAMPQVPPTFGRLFLEGAGKAIGAGAVGLGLGLGIHGISSSMNAAGTANLRGHYERALAQVMSSNAIVADADPAKVRSYGETLFKFAPHIAADVHILSTLLVSAVHGEGIDPTIIKNIVDLEAKMIESRKNALFSPKSYL